MKSISIKTGMMLVAILFVSLVNAQRPGRTRTNPPIKQQPEVIPPGPKLDGLPILIDSASVFDTTIPKSMKPPGAFGTQTGHRIPLDYENLRWDDALYAQKVWRELDLREKMNQSFRYDAIDDKGSTLFMNILIKAVKSGEVQTFKDDRFSIPVAMSQVTAITSGKLDTVLRVNPTTLLPDAYIVTRESFDAKSVTRLLIMEEWILDSKGSRLHCRIIGLAPLRMRTLPGANQKEAASIMFWVNYGDLRPILANAEVYNPKNMGHNRLTWEELFESRMFSSYIVKSTIDNASNRAIRASIKDPVLALLEGDNIKEKIFNYEQDLWSY